MDAKKHIEYLGGASAVGCLLGITSQAVSQWRVIPVARALQLEKLTENKVSRYDMRPDIFGQPPRELTA